MTMNRFLLGVQFGLVLFQLVLWYWMVSLDSPVAYFIALMAGFCLYQALRGRELVKEIEELERS